MATEEQRREWRNRVVLAKAYSEQGAERMHIDCEVVLAVNEDMEELRTLCQMMWHSGGEALGELFALVFPEGRP